MIIAFFPKYFPNNFAISLLESVQSKYINAMYIYLQSIKISKSGLNCTTSIFEVLLLVH